MGLNIRGLEPTHLTSIIFMKSPNNFRCSRWFWDGNEKIDRGGGFTTTPCPWTGITGWSEFDAGQIHMFQNERLTFISKIHSHPSVLSLRSSELDLLIWVYHSWTYLFVLLSTIHRASTSDWNLGKRSQGDWLSIQREQMDWLSAVQRYFVCRRTRHTHQGKLRKKWESGSVLWSLESVYQNWRKVQPTSQHSDCSRSKLDKIRR